MESPSAMSIAHGFKKCCISNASDGSDDDVLWEGLVQQQESDDDSESDSDAEDLCT
ncbi:Hypothetical protein FKW44_004126 [Caligus rogercresseyi]|uniref:Uncharacterized protein n=1 Tax=Caligus rogercresseyi TaxID=217165 RepID=A0A7T8KAE5_CALRO|nr:Hypothetical protein FKW44_004126 [Caligus rogercresseyi]